MKSDEKENQEGGSGTEKAPGKPKHTAPSRDPNYRENPQRAIQVFGLFGPEMVRRLTPQIVKLRNEDPKAPITVYIDSEGGSIQHYDFLEGLLFKPDQDGNCCRIITVATSFAASAAARLLARGDYSIAYPSALIHCHGARYEGEWTLTRERAEFMSESLAVFNSDMAADFTHKIIENLAWLYRFNDEEIKSRGEGPHIYGLSSLIQDSLDFSSKPLISGVLRELHLTTSLQLFISQKSRDTALRKAVKKGKGREDFRLLKFIVDFLESKAGEYQLAEGVNKETISELIYLYSLQRDYYKKFMSDCDDPDTLLMMLCDAVDIDRAKSIVNKEERRNFLLEKSAGAMFSAWQLGTTIAANLVKGENSLAAPDAYWLGLVDEVVGRNDLPCKRHIVEAIELT